MTDRKNPRRHGHPYDGTADAAATATKHTRIIPDGAHYSGLGKDYGGMYNPDYESELDRLKRERNDLLEALQDVDRFFAASLDPEEDQESWDWLCWLKVKAALASLHDPDANPSD